MNWPGWRGYLVTPSEQQPVTACTWVPVPSAPSAQRRPHSRQARSRSKAANTNN